jgi:hypothetical protein
MTSSFTAARAGRRARRPVRQASPRQSAGDGTGIEGLKLVREMGADLTIDSRRLCSACPANRRSVIFRKAALQRLLQEEVPKLMTVMAGSGHVAIFRASNSTV